MIYKIIKLILRITNCFFPVKTVGVVIYYITFNEIDIAYSSLFYTKNKLIK